MNGDFYSESAAKIKTLFTLAIGINKITSTHHHHHQSLNREGRWGTTDDFATSFLHFSLFSTALWDFPNSRPVHFPDVVFLPLPLSALSSYPFHCALQNGFGKTG